MLEIQGLSKVFHKGTIDENVVFDRLSVRIEKGDFVSIIGSNGAGKSTLLNIISGSTCIDEGSIFLSCREISKLPEFKRTRFIGRVFQNPSMGTSPSMTILENLSMAINKGKGGALRPGISKRNMQQFIDMLKELSLGLEDRLNTRIGLLSGGQRQALSLLMASISNPDILLLDEHTAALDPSASERVMAITRNIVSKGNITTLMVTHNLGQAINVGNRLLMLHQGRIVLDVKGEEKKSLTMDKLMGYFEKVRLRDSLSDRLIFSGMEA
jgi:putative ABC transport system ATP-binding protein